MLAASRNYKEVVVELARAGANVYEKNKVRELLTYFQHNVIVVLLLFVVVWGDSSHVGC